MALSPTSSRAASGTVGGDLSGTLPDPTVAKVNGVAVTGAPSAGYVPTATSASAATWQAGATTPAGLRVVDYLFTEVATAGVYTAPTLALAARDYLIDVQWWLTPASTGDWQANTAAISVVDSGLGVLITGQTVKGGTVDSPNSAADIVILQHAYVYPNLASTVDPVGGGTITTTITTTIASPPVVPKAVMIVRMIYITAPTPAVATFA